ncbi:hypothetical protein QWZ08_13775 [Ferruginibacter paludis]|nr:hypothetical protein [Ferruginibacter paludis]MDN3656709.1 hypothetical protein [Ferruginibacter paludis]
METFIASPDLPSRMANAACIKVYLLGKPVEGLKVSVRKYGVSMNEL